MIVEINMCKVFCSSLQWSSFVCLSYMSFSSFPHKHISREYFLHSGEDLVRRTVSPIPEVLTCRLMFWWHPCPINLFSAVFRVSPQYWGWLGQCLSPFLHVPMYWMLGVVHLMFLWRPGLPQYKNIKINGRNWTSMILKQEFCRSSISVNICIQFFCL